MQQNYIKLRTNSELPFMPIVAYDTYRKALVHLYEFVTLEPSTFQQNVSQYVNRKESFSSNVASIYKLKDEHIKFKNGVASLDITVVSDYVPWRLHKYNPMLTYEQGLFLLEGSIKGFRQLLYRLKTPFMVEQYMIGVDAYGEVKVWWNQHFFKNNFTKGLQTNFKLREMITSMVNCLTFKMNYTDASIFRNSLLINKEVNFIEIEKRLQELSKGLDLKVIGKNMIKEDRNIASILSRVQEIQQNKAIGTPVLATSEVKKSTFFSESPTNPEKFDDIAITKRTYKDGTAPPQPQKMNIIKEDIEKLRFIKNEKDNSPEKLKVSRSLTNFVSISKGLFGDQSIPQVRNAMKYSTVLEDNFRPSVSLFPQSPQYQSQIVTPTKQSADNCNVCSEIHSLRRSQTIHQTDLYLSKVKSSNNLSTSKALFSTERSNTSTIMKKSSLSPKFGESGHKLQSKSYFASVLE